MPPRSIRDVNVAGARVLVRVDFNVPIASGVVTDDTRITAALPTIRHLQAQGARVILMSHLGRPKGGPDPRHTLGPVARRLSEHLGRPVAMAPDCVGEAVERLAAGLGPGEALLLENLRFHPEEEANDPAFAAQLARLGDVYVNDAFGAAHRAHASTEGVARAMPVAVAGFLIQAELEHLGRALEAPTRPFVAILGGAKISDKVGVIDNLLTRVDRILVGGAMANTFLRAQGRAMGQSLVEEGALDTARRLLEAGGARLVLPVDLIVGDGFDAAAEARPVAADQVPPGWRAMDIGPQTIERFRAEIAPARTVVWNGPMGVFEFPRFAEGTMAVARAVAASGATSIVGGGDSVAAVQQAGCADRITHLSTGGGASLEFLEGKVLPGVAALHSS